MLPPATHHQLDDTSNNPSVAGAVHPPRSNNRAGRVHAVATSFPITLKFEEVVYKVKVYRPNKWWENVPTCCPAAGSAKGAVKEKTILNGMTGAVYPGEMLAMLGPSGSGKTTLLTALGRRAPPSTAGSSLLSGKITYNGNPFSSAVKRRIGFVSQEDILYPHLTVLETLWYTALLRLPRALGEEEKRAQVDVVIAELGLGAVSNCMVGGVRGVRGLSGGERKRVSISLELLVDPSLMLLDEPTSGLDSTTAAKIVGKLRRLAVEGRRTVVVTIHQPSTRLFHMFDKVLLMSAEGWPIYYGTAANSLAYFASIGFASPISVNPADLMLDLANGIVPHIISCDEENQQGSNSTDQIDQQKLAVKEKLILAYDRNIAPCLKAELCSNHADTTTSSGGGSSNNNNIIRTNHLSYAAGVVGKLPAGWAADWNTSWGEQFIVLLRRGVKERRHESFSNLRIFQVLSVAFLAGLLWLNTPPSHIQDRTALVFFFSVFWGFFPLYNAVFTFPVERPMLIKERSSGMYRLSSYFLARTAADLPMELGLPTAFVIILYWMGGLKPDAGSFLLSLLVVLYSVLVAQSLGMALGAVLMDIKQGTTLASVITMVFLIAGGYYIQNIPPFIAWLKYLSYSFYCYRLLLGVQYSDGDRYECSNGVMCPVTEFLAIKAVGLDHLWVDVCSMALMLVGYRLVAYLALQRLQAR